MGSLSLTYMNIEINQLYQQEPLVFWVVYWPSMQDIPGSNLARGGYRICNLVHYYVSDIFQ